MEYKHTTQVPNIVFDNYLPQLSLSELKLLLVIVRQTYGWINKKTGKRKMRDRISHSQFMKKTGLSRRVITKTIQSLITKGLITVTDFKDNLLHIAKERKGRGYLYYAFSYPQPVHISAHTSASEVSEPVHLETYNKTKYKKLIKTKEIYPKKIGAIIKILEQELMIKRY